MILRCLAVLMAAAFPVVTAAGQSADDWEWPDGRRAALSLTFDDARTSQVDVGTGLLDRHDVKATFYVVPGAVEQRLEGWKAARDAGHEIGNHSLRHPCSGNFRWARDKALESYSVDEMRRELEEANRRIMELLGVEPTTFAYPCGQAFIGRGVATRSYVPIVAELFEAGRGWMDEAPNDPAYVDLAQITGIEMDGKDFSEILPFLEGAAEEGLWLVLAGHEIGEEGNQTTSLAMLDELIRYASDPDHEIWLAPVATVASYIRQQRSP